MTLHAEEEMDEDGLAILMWSEADENTTGPASFMDPDGNPILVDQHV
jgi:hypothetical protein